MRIVREEYQWGKKAKELEELCYQVSQHKAEATGEA